jgi:preprotein translocase subunit SecD
MVCSKEGDALMGRIGVRTWILIVCLILAILAISPSFKSGALIKSVDRNSTAYEEGLRAGMVVKEVDNMVIKTASDYSTAMQSLFENANETRRVTIKTEDTEFIFLSRGIPEISVADIPHTHIKTGLDLSGGARAIVKASNATLTDAELADLIAITEERLNTFGISDVSVRPVSDLSGNKFMLIEIAGATPEDIKDLVGRQGVFTAKIGNQTVFEGSKGDITDVCRNDATCAGLRGCNPAEGGGYICTFDFALYLSEKAADKHAAITRNLTVDPTGQYLSEKMSMYVDNIEATEALSISVGLRGQKTTQISIQGSGSGATQEDAANDARNKMKKLQTVLITGSLPWKLEIVKLDTISPSLGKTFTKSLVYLGLLVFVLVSLAIFIRYRKVKLTLAVMLTMVSEALLTLGIAALIRWNLDAPGIAGIIAGIGTGVNDQIVILDEARHSAGESSSLKERVKRALFIVFGAFLTIVAAMLPLFWAGAGLLRGFALTTILGVTVGILITRPAFAEIIRKIEEN